VVAEQKLFFITLGGPTAHDSSGRDDKGEGGDSGGFEGTAVVSHISRKTSEMWGTPAVVVGIEAKRLALQALG
jgi:hypothetical protein